jgi:hypothetical protein
VFGERRGVGVEGGGRGFRGTSGSGDADSGEDDLEEEEERLDEDEPELLELLLLLLELELRSRLRRHADCDPLSRKGQSVSVGLSDPSLRPVGFPASFFPPRLASPPV